MKAAVLNQSNYSFEIKEIPKPALIEGNILINIKSVSLNHHELWLLKEKSLKSETPIILGSDGAGVISEIGANVKNHFVGSEVIINPSLNWGDNPTVQGNQYEILGFPTQGTFAEYISIPSEYVFQKPSHLNFQEAAALPLAGLTAYRALFIKGQISNKDKILITGIGGGVALFALKFAIAHGNPVFITSSDPNKIKSSIALGAKGGVLYTVKDWDKELLSYATGFDLVIDGSGGENLNQIIRLMNPGGRICIYGRTAGNISSFQTRQLFNKQISILGTLMGNESDFSSMIEFVSKNQIKPVLDEVMMFDQIQYAFERMRSGSQFGKITLNIGRGE